MKSDKWAAATIAGLLGVAVGAGHLQTFAIAGCDAKASAVDYGCFEFWFNRYQTAWAALLGTAGTLIAAGFAWVAVQRQIAEATRQTVLSRWQAAFAVRAAMVRDRDLTKRAHGSLAAIAESLAGIAIAPWLPTTLDSVMNIQNKADENLTEVNSAGSPWSAATNDVRERILLALAEQSIKCTKMNGELRMHVADGRKQKGSSLVVLGKEAIALNVVLATLRGEYIERTSREVAEIGHLCEQLRTVAFGSLHSAASIVNSGSSAGAGRSISRGW